MAYRKKTRRIRRTRRTTRKKRTVSNALVTKSFLKKTLAKSIESKRNTHNVALEHTDEVPYLLDLVGRYIVPGVTDEGRIGNTIHLTGVNVRYVFTAALSTDVLVTTRWPPVTLKMFLIQSKNNFFTPTSQWFKSFDSGNTDPTVPLTDESINDGRRILNTDNFTVLGSHTHKLMPELGKPLVQYTGMMRVPLKNKKMVFNSNNTSANGTADIMPPIYLVYYFYTGFLAGSRDPALEWGCRASITTYYKDT